MSGWETEAWIAVALLIDSPKLSSVNPQRCLTDLLTRIVEE